MERVYEKIKSFLGINDSGQRARSIVVSSLFTGVLSYFFLMVNGNTNPDGIVEGLYYYVNADLTSQNGRWAVRYVNKWVSNNVIIPHITVVIYCCCVALSVIMLCKIWKINKKSTMVILPAIMVATPVVIGQLTYVHMGLCYSFALLFSVAFVYLCWLGGIKNCIGSAVCLSISLGLYQSYIGVAVLVSIITVILKLIDGEKWKRIVKDGVQFCVMGIISMGLYYLMMLLDLKYHNLNKDTRVQAFDIISIFRYLPSSVKGAYRAFFKYFNDGMMSRNLLYLLVLASGIIFLFIILWQRHRKDWERIVCIIILLVLCPLGANAIHIIVPYNVISNIMSYQMVMMIPFVCALMERVDVERLYTEISELVCCGSIVLLLLSYIVSANATFRCYQISYNYIHTQMEQAMADVYKLDGYVINETPILMAGFPSDKELRKIQIYNYSIGVSDNVAFWEVMLGAMGGRFWYFMNFLGVNPMWFSYEEYTDIVLSEEFEKMPVWPYDGSVKIINGLAVIKFSEEPPMP